MKSIQRVFRMAITIILEFYFRLVNLFSNRSISGENKGIVVSLTTYNQRINSVYLTIESLFNQTVRPDKICLWLSLEEFPEKALPTTLKRLQKRGLEINFMEGNLKSYKKLIYSLELFPEATIITADDDVLYPSEWYGKLLKAHKKNPVAILCFRGHYLEFDESGQLYSYVEMSKREKYGNLLGYNLMPTGVSGILYPPKSLNEVATNRPLFQSICPHADDIWFKACALLNGTMSMRVSKKNERFRQTFNSRLDGLAKVNVGKGQNDVQLKDVFQYFDLFKYIKNEKAC